MKHIKQLRNSNVAMLPVKLLGLVGLIIPITGFSNPATGMFPPMQVPQGYMPTGQFPQMRPQVPNYQAYPYQSPYGGMPWMQQRPTAPAYNYYPYQQTAPATAPRQMNYNTPNYQFSNMTPFGNSFSPTSMFNNNNFPTPWSNTSNWNPWTNGNNSQMPFFPQQNTNKKKAWGDVRHIWPDFYTEFTDEFWDQSTNGPYDMGRMPGGWRAPSLSSPDPVTVGDAVLNQFPPMMEEVGNMMDFSN